MLATATFHQSLSLGKKLLENGLKEDLDQSYRESFKGYDICNNKILIWKVLLYLLDEISTEEGVNIYPYNLCVTHDTDTYF